MSKVAKTVRAAVKRVIPEQIIAARAAVNGYRDKLGTRPNLLFPSKFTEKVQWRKVFVRDKRLPLLADKVLVKDFVKDRIGAEHVIPTLWHGEVLPPRHQRAWPIPFVVKANHGCGFNAFVRSPAECDWDRIEQTTAAWLETKYGEWGGEWMYSVIKRQLLVEPFVGKDSCFPFDYKVWVFNGVAHFVQVDTDRETLHKRAMFDRDWVRLNFQVTHPLSERRIERPVSLDEILKFSEMLASGFDFVRVDFYEIDGVPKFGEMTFYPEAGYGRFLPNDMDVKVGSLWH